MNRGAHGRQKTQPRASATTTTVSHAMQSVANSLNAFMIESVTWGGGCNEMYSDTNFLVSRCNN